MKMLASFLCSLFVVAAAPAAFAADELIGDPKILGSLDPAKTREAGVKASAAAEKLGWRIGSQTYTLRDRSLVEALDTLYMLGINNCEAYPGQAISPEMKNVKFGPGMPPEAVDVVKKKLAQTGIKILSIGVIGVPSKEEDARKLFQFAKDFGMERIVTEAGKGTFDLMQKLGEEFNIDIALHNHPEPNIYGTPEKVLEAIGPNHTRIGSCSDFGHWQRSKIVPVEGLKKLEGKVFESHFKDLNEFGVKGAKDVPWGTGKGDARGILEECLRQTKAGKIGGSVKKMTYNIEYETGHGTELVANMAKCIEWFGKTCEELAAK